MSTTIDEKVVEMRFDNRNFERNVQGTLSTLDKLKQKLNLTGASKGLEQINTSANKVNLSGMANAIETVHLKFSALDVFVVTALARISNAAITAGKRITSALTIDPIKTGLQEYETQINAVQTILANTQKEGADITKVNAALDELNTYADKTIYNFTEMTRNIGTFTAAGVKLDTSVSAIKGIANLAAVSGSTSQQASTAMYQLSQALASGSVKLMDWNSVVNAGMGGQVFQDALMETARVHGINIDKMIKKEGSFRETLKDGWLSSEILTETLEKFTYASEEMTEAEKERVTTMLKSKGYTDKQIEGIFKLGNTATEAATKVKTFTQLWDVLKEAAQSGWAQTWRLIIGDFEQAKAFFTPLATFLTNVINGFSEARNKLIESALGKSFKGLLDNIKSVKESVEVIKDYASVVNEIINGKWGNGQARWDKLTEAGYDWAHAQNLVNEKLGDGTRHATNFSEAQNGVAKSQKDVNESTADHIIGLMKLTEAELKAKGYTEEQIQALKDLAEASDKTGIPLKELIENIDEIDGRWLLVNSLKNLGMSLVSIFTSVGKAFRNAFPPMESDTLFNIIAGLHKFSVIIRNHVEENADNLTRTLKGLFAIIDLIAMVIGGGLKIAFGVLKAVLSVFNLDLLQFTALIGDALVAVRDFIENNILVKGIEFIITNILIAVKYTKEWITNNKTLMKHFNKAKESLKKFADGIKNWTENLKEMDNAPKHIIDGLVNGLKNGAKFVKDAIVGLAKGLIEGFCKVLGIHSPSKKFFEFGNNIIQGLINGIGNGISWVIDSVKNLGNTIINVFKNIKINPEFLEKIKTAFEKFKTFFKEFDYSKLLAIIPVAVILFLVKKIADVISSLTDGINGLNEVIEGFAEVERNFSKVLSSFALSLKADALKKVAEAIAILVGSIVVLTLVDKDKLATATGTIVMLSLVLAGLMFALSKMSDASVKIGKDGFNFGGLKTGLVSLAAALLLLSIVVKNIGSLDTKQAIQGFIGLGLLLVELGVFLGVCGALVKGKSFKRFDKIGSMMLKLSIALMLMVGVCKLVSKLTPEEMGKGAVFALAFAGFVAILSKIGNDANEHISKLGGMVIKLTIAMALMVGVIKLVSLLTPGEMIKGAAFALAFVGFVKLLTMVTKVDKDHQTAKLGGMLLSMSLSLMLMVGVCKLVNLLSVEEMIKGAAFVAAFVILVKVLVSVTTITSEQQIAKVAGTILAMSMAIGILAGISILLSMVPLEGLARGVGAVTLLGLVMAAMVWACRGVTNIVGNLVVMTVAIGIMAIAVAALSAIDPSRLAGATTAMTVLIGMFAILAKVAGSVTAGMGTLIIMTTAVVLIGAMLYQLATLPVEQTLGAAAGLSMLILALSGAMLLLSAVGAMGPAAFIGIGALATFIVGMTAVVVAIGALMEKIPALQSFLDTGIQTLIKLAGGIGEIIGAFVGGILTRLTSGLPEIGTNLSLFMTNAMPFITGAKLVDENVLKGVGVLAAAILALTATDLITGIATFLSGGTSFASLGTELSMFIMNAMPFIMFSKQIDPAVMEGIKNLAEAILIITGVDLLQNLTSWLSGENSLANFGTQLSGLGTSLNQFVTSLGTFTEAQVATVNCAAQAIKSLASAASEIPNEGGLWAKIVGENSLATFGSYLPGLGSNLSQFITSLGTFTDAQVTTIDCAGRAIKALAQAASEVPNEGGLWGKIVGENSLATFAGHLPGLGTNLNSFVKNLGTFSEAQVATVDCAGRAIKALADAANNIPNEGGLWAKIAGDNSLATFGEKLPGLAKSIASFVKNLGTFSSGQLSTVSSACDAIRSIAELGKIDISNTGSNLEEFGARMISFANKLNEFMKSMAGVSKESVSSATTKVKDLIDMAKTVANTNVDSLKTFSKSLKDVAKDGVKGFVKEFSGGTPKSEAKKAVKAMVESGIKGAEDKKSDVKKKFKSIAEAAVDALCTSTLKSDAKQAGKDLVTGFANGIKNNKSLATDAGKSIGKAALKAAKEAIDSNSPSKEAMKIGNYFGQGLVIGIEDYESKSYKAGFGIADYAKNGLSKAISKVSDIINNDIDAQPTIRPVLDLSDVESGAGYLSSMFNSGPSIGVMSNLRAISNGMNSRNQNGANDVVSAIDKLSKKLGNVGGNSYTINGITYDDGSNITEAVQALVRAAIKERRV